MSLLWETPCHFYRKELSTFVQNIRLWVPSQHMKWDAALQWETFIAAWLLINLPLLYNGSWQSLWQHLWAQYGPNHVNSVKTNSQFAYIMSDFRYPLNRGNEMMCCKERHSLLFGCFITFLRCIRMFRWASDSIYKPVMAHTVSFPVEHNSHISYKIPFCFAPSSQGKWDIVLQEETYIAGWVFHK